MLADDVAHVLPELRAQAESLMTSTCTITAEPTEYVTDPDTGEVAETPGEVMYQGRCRIKPAAQWGRQAEAGGEQVLPTTYLISVPYAATGIERGAIVLVDTSPDPWLIGRRFEVRFSPMAGDHLTARRLLCEEPS